MSDDGGQDDGLNPEYGAGIRFGNAAADYSTHRATYPDELFERLAAFDVGLEGQSVLDLGTGTGFVAHALAERGCTVVGADIDRELLLEARDAGDESRVGDGDNEPRVGDDENGSNASDEPNPNDAPNPGDEPNSSDESNTNDEPDPPSFLQARAELIPFRDDAFDVVTAGQCWHWFDRERTRRECRRVIAPGGRLVVTHFDWLPADDNVVAATEELIHEWSPAWPGGGGDGFHPRVADDVRGAGFEAVETFTFDVDVPYTHEAWRGRIRASAGVGGSLSEPAVRAFDDELAALLADRFPAEPLAVPHRSFTLVCEAPT